MNIKPNLPINNENNHPTSNKSTFSKVWIIFGLFFSAILAIAGVVIIMDKDHDTNAPYILWGFSFALFVFILGTGKIIELLEIIADKNK